MLANLLVAACTSATLVLPENQSLIDTNYRSPVSLIRYHLRLLLNEETKQILLFAFFEDCLQGELISYLTTHCIMFLKHTRCKLLKHSSEWIAITISLFVQSYIQYNRIYQFSYRTTPFPPTVPAAIIQLGASALADSNSSPNAASRGWCVVCERHDSAFSLNRKDE